MDLGAQLIGYLFKFFTKVVPKIAKVLWGTGTLFLAFCFLVGGKDGKAVPVFFWWIGWAWAILGVTKIIVRKVTKQPKWGYIKFITNRTQSGAEKKVTNPTIPSELQATEPTGFLFGKQGNLFARKAENMDGHVLVVGGAGSGKSSAIAIPTLLTWQERIFAIDIKGELSKLTSKSRGAVKIFNPTDQTSFGYDPFGILRNSKNLVQDITEIVLALVPLPTDIKEPFWITGAQNMLKGSLIYFYKQGLSFSESITEIQSQPIAELIDTIYANNDKESTLFISQFVGMDSKTISGVFTELSNNILLFATDSDIQNALSKSSNISPADLESGYDIFIVIPEHKLDQWKKLLSLMVNQFLKYFEQRNEETATPILFMLDEFARLGKIETIVNGLATLRSKKISIAILTQSMAQLDLIYGKETRQVIADNCSYKAILSATDSDTQEYLSKLVGTYDRMKQTTSASFEQMTGLGSGTSESQSTEEKRIIKPEDFATLKDVVVLSPFGFFRVDKAPYYQDPTIQAML